MNPLASRLALAWLLLPLLATGAPAAVAAPAALPATGAWSLGADVVFSTVESARVPGGFGLDQTARGLGLRVGRELDPRWRLEANVSVAEHATSQPDATLRLTRATLEAVRRFRPGGPVRPWLAAGAGWFQVGTHAGDLPCTADGPGVVLAAGWEVRLHPRLWLHGAARGEAVRWQGGPSLPTPLFDHWRASSQVTAGLTILL